MKLHGATRGLAISVVAAIVFTACTGSAPAAPSQSAAAAGVQRDPDAVLRIGASPNFMIIDPIVRRQIIEDHITREIFDRLVNHDSADKIVPGLATEWKTLDGNIVQLKLRQGVTFQDGTPFNAAAVKFNLDRAKTSAESTIKPDLAYMDSVSVVDDSTVNIKLTAPVFAPFLEVLADRAGMVASPTAVQKAGTAEIFSRNPVGAGMYKMLEWTPAVSVKLRKWDGYWDKSAALLGGIDFVGASSDTISLALQSGDLDIGTDPALTVAGSKPGIRVQIGSSYAFSTLVLNVLVKPFDNQKVRQAMMYAVDKEAASKVLCPQGCEIATQPVPKSSWAYSPTEAQSAPKYDPAKAKQILADAGFPNGVSFVYQVNSGLPDYVRTAELLQQMLKPSGFEITIQLVDPTQLTPNLYGNKTKNDCGKVAATVHVAAITSPDPDQVLAQRYLKDATRNVGCVEAPGLRDLALQGASVTDLGARKPIYEKAWALVRDFAAPDLPLWFNTSVNVNRDYVGGIKAAFSPYSITFRGVWISKGKVPIPQGQLLPAS